MPKPCDSDHFGLGRVGEYFTDFPNQNVWGKIKKTKTPWAVSFKTKMHGVFAWECGVRKVPKTHGLDAIQSKTFKCQTPHAFWLEWPMARTCSL